MTPEHTSNHTARIVLVTGGGQGIGRAISERFASNGDQVIIADVNPSAAATAEEIGGEFLLLDITDAKGIAAAADELTQRYGRLDVLINNAGASHETSLLDTTDELWARIIGLNLTATFTTTREFGRILTRQRAGTIVNIASISGIIANSPEVHAAYDASKAGVIQFTRSVAAEWASYGVRVNAVAPGRARTPILDGIGATNPERMSVWIDQSPQRRLLEPAEIAAVAFFLASDAASAITGQTVVADGGITLW